MAWAIAWRLDPLRQPLTRPHLPTQPRSRPLPVQAQLVNLQRRSQPKQRDQAVGSGAVSRSASRTPIWSGLRTEGKIARYQGLSFISLRPQRPATAPTFYAPCAQLLRSTRMCTTRQSLTYQGFNNQAFPSGRFDRRYYNQEHAPYQPGRVQAQYDDSLTIKNQKTINPSTSYLCIN